MHRDMRLLVVGVDPGVTTGVAVVEWIGSDEGEIIDLYEHYADEMDDWWETMGCGGGVVAALVYAQVMQWWEEHDGSGFVLVAMEDYVPNPQKMSAGAYDRNAVSPVAVGAVFRMQLDSMLGAGAVRWSFQMPSAKAVVKDRNGTFMRLYAEGRERGSGVGAHHGHSADALRHAMVGKRSFRV